MNDENDQKDKRKIFNFSNELKDLMFAFGDVDNPDPESLLLLEEYIIEFIQNISIRAYKRSKIRGYNEIKLTDLLLELKHDKKKYYRSAQILYNTYKKID